MNWTVEEVQMGLTKDLCVDLFQIELNKTDVEQLKTLIIDYFAATYAGYKYNRSLNRAVESVVLSQGDVEDSWVFKKGKCYPAGTAALINSLYGHGLDLDDGNKKAAGHVGVHVIPAVFALADKLNSSNDDVLLALATGYETFIRVSSAAQPGIVSRGFHSTGITGTLACATACARLFHLDAQGIEDSLALATTMSAGLLSYGDSRPAIKPLNPGKAAENGLFAAMLANEGVQGPTMALEGQNGWFHAMTDKVHVEYLHGSDHLLLHDCYLKLYPSCRHTHCGIDAAIKLYERVENEEIDAVNVYIYPNAIKLAGIASPKNNAETKFSIKYTLAVSLIKGAYGTDDMNPHKVDNRVKNLMERINLIEDPLMENRDKGIRGARVELIMKGGRHEEETVMVPKGEPENPLTREDIINKLKTCAKGQTKGEDLLMIVNKINMIEGNRIFDNPIRYTGGER